MARYVDTALRPGEKILYDAKVHWAVFISPIVKLIVYTIIALVATGMTGLDIRKLALSFTSADIVKDLDWVFWVLSKPYLVFLIVLLPLSGLVNAFIYYYNSDFVVTDRRVIAKFGLLSRATTEQRLSKVESISVYQSFLGRLLNFGNIVVTGTGSSDTFFGPMVDPVKCKHALEEQLDTLRVTKAED